MILTLSEAKLIDESISQEDLDGIEQTIRALTNNNFQNRDIRFKNIDFLDHETIKVNEDIKGIKVGDTVEVNYSPYNDGLYEVIGIAADTIKVKPDSLYNDINTDAMLTKVEYPADIKTGVKKLLEYDKKMGDKTGIKSETISRMSTTYYDMNSSENIDGYPSSLLSFVKKYEKMRW